MLDQFVRIWLNDINYNLIMIVNHNKINWYHGSNHDI